MTEMFAAPAAAAGFRPEDYNGRLLLISPYKLEEGVSTTFGAKDAIRCDVAVLDGDEPQEHADTLIFGLVLIGQLRSRIGQRVLGRLGQGIAKAGQKPPWKLSEATPQDTAVAVAWLNKTSLAAPASDAPPF